MTIQKNIEILILDDEKDFTAEMHAFLVNSGFGAFETNTDREAFNILDKHEIDLLILDVILPGVNGLDILKEVRTLYPSIEVIVISAHGDMDTVVKAMRLGAFDYLRKPFRHIDIQIAIERSQKFLELQQRLKHLEERSSLISQQLEEKINRQFIGQSKHIQEVYEQAITASKYPDTNVLITGESGTGKENIARIIHYASEKKKNIFYTINVCSITESLLGSELFGHKKGSFTGAVSDKTGYFEMCNGGTLFFDEIAEMPMSMQANILRAIEEKVITRVGDTKEIRTDFRIISATNNDLDKKVSENTFRLDLLYRLNTLHIHITPLRDRPEDIKPLVKHFVNHFVQMFNKQSIHIPEDVFDHLSTYDFPGNVRELRNLCERAVILCKGHLLSRNEFPLKRGKSKKNTQKEQFDLKTQEINMIQDALRSSDFNQKSASDLLGISRDALIRRMKKYHISIQKIES